MIQQLKIHKIMQYNNRENKKKQKIKMNTNMLSIKKSSRKKFLQKKRLWSNMYRIRNNSQRITITENQSPNK